MKPVCYGTRMTAREQALKLIASKSAVQGDRGIGAGARDCWGAGAFSCCLRQSRNGSAHFLHRSNRAPKPLPSLSVRMEATTLALLNLHTTDIAEWFFNVLRALLSTSQTGPRTLRRNYHSHAIIPGAGPRSEPAELSQIQKSVLVRIAALLCVGVASVAPVNAVLLHWPQKHQEVPAVRPRRRDRRHSHCLLS